MPSPAVLDCDGGTNWYADAFDFKRIRVTDVDQVYQAVDELIKDPTGVNSGAGFNDEILGITTGKASKTNAR